MMRRTLAHLNPVAALLLLISSSSAGAAIDGGAAAFISSPPRKWRAALPPPPWTTSPRRQRPGGHDVAAASSGSNRKHRLRLDVVYVPRDVDDSEHVNGSDGGETAAINPPEAPPEEEVTDRDPARLYPEHEYNRVERIILIRHGESLGNVDESSYGHVADWRIPLTEQGREQAREAGRTLDNLLSCHIDDDDDCIDRSVFFYVSPYLRTRQTLRCVVDEIDRDRIIGIREEPRISEQQFGNYQNPQSVLNAKVERGAFGRFYYRFPDGESGFDVYNRVSSFISTVFRDVEQLHARGHDRDRVNICIVTHGLALRLILMRWFQYTVHEFEESYNPENGGVVVLERHTNVTNGLQWFELREESRIMLNLPAYSEQSRFRVGDDLSILDEDWDTGFDDIGF